MAMKDLDGLDRIISEIEPDHIPAEFVSAARITDLDGDTYIVTAEELEDIMMDEASLEEQGIKNIGLILDVESIKAAINEYSEIILSSIPL